MGVDIKLMVRKNCLYCYEKKNNEKFPFEKDETTKLTFDGRIKHLKLK
jgi:hypothetical protein